MLQKVSVAKKEIDRYRHIMGDDYIDSLHDLARKLRNLKIIYINSTPFGGGVAELLSSSIPLMKDLGLNVDWRVIYGDMDFFEITKGFHNALQGAPYKLTSAIKERYLGNIMTNAENITDGYDIIVVNDPQPAALPHYAGGLDSKWIWRSHIDSSEPNKEVIDFLKPFLERYDLAIFTMEEFIPPKLDIDTEIIWPAIDIFNTKNMDLPAYLARQVIANSGVDISKPILLQVSRFDPWKDPLGVIKTYRLVKEEIAELQLVLIGAMAQDDPQGWEMYSTISKEAVNDPDLHVFTNMTGVGNLEVNSFQRGSDVVLQKSIREGFGLVVSEAMWKETPVVAGRAGGIVVQMKEAGIDHYLIDTIEEAAGKISHLLRNPEEGLEAGEKERQEVINHFIMPRLIRDELNVFLKIMNF